MLRLGTRGSLLARTQSTQVADRIAATLGEPVELVVIRTEGDDLTVPLESPSRPGAFAAALRDALLDGRVDIVVHSFKDLPSAPLPGAMVAAVPEREDPRDAWCSLGLRLAGAPAGTRVGTSSPRRVAALRRVNPGLVAVPVRGNVDTRLRKLRSGEVDALVLAAAGLNRCGLGAAITEYLGADTMLPAPAQGALAVECRTGALAKRLADLDHAPTRLTVTAERAVLAGISATCTTAVGASAMIIDDRLVLAAEVSDHRGVAYARATRTAPVTGVAAAEALGLAVAADLLENPR